MGPPALLAPKLDTRRPFGLICEIIRNSYENGKVKVSRLHPEFYFLPRSSTQRKRVIAGRHLYVFVYPKTERTVSVGFVLK
jgi:hypothetical protein